MSYPEQINLINTKYFRSEDVKELKSARQELFQLLESGKLSEDNKKNATGLAYRVSVKIALLSYFDANCTDNELEISKKELELLFLADGKEKIELVNTVDLISKAQKFLEEIGPVFSDAAMNYELVIGTNGQPIVAEIREFNSAIRKIEKIKERAIEKFNEKPSIFGKDVAFYNIVENINKNLDRFLYVIQKEKSDTEKRLYGSAIAETINPISSLKFKLYKYYSKILDDEKSEAAIRVILSPFEEEVEYLFESYISRNKLSGAIVNIDKFSKYNKSVREYLVEYLKGNYKYILFDNFSASSISIEEILESAISLALWGAIIFIHDISGSKLIYKKLTESIMDREHKPTTSYLYFTLPFFTPIIDELKSMKIVNNEEDVAFVKKDCQFMGFIGFNELIISFASYGGDKWKSKAKSISEKNREVAIKYLLDLPSQEQLLDLDWGVIIKDTESKNEKRVGVPHDYDVLRSYDERNLNKILENPLFNLIEKVGLAVKYCLLNGESSSTLSSIEKRELEDRLIKASKILAKIINTEFDPEVFVIAKKDFPKEEAVGQCCNRGAVIKYRYEDMRDFSTAFGTVCHEMFHSLQFTIMNTGWKIWHLEELGISRSRVKEWKTNESIYIDVSKDKDAYYVQCFEADARIFESDALIAAGEKWSIAELE